ncbi:MAG TPA: MFS transporter, partial [Gemmatimonadaceae bacterium]|nr:MFS transporter [Gemmatimonadaceae bacterium]
IIGSLLGWSVTTFLTAYARSFPELLVARVCLGLSECCCVPASMALITDFHRGPSRTLAMGVYQTGMMAGMMLGGIGGWLSEAFSWRVAFMLTSLPAIVYGLFLIFVLRDAPPETAPGAPKPPQRSEVRFGDALRTLLRTRSFLLEMGAVVVLGAAGWIIVGWLPVFITERFGLAQGEAGLSATAYLNGATALGLLLGGWWTSRWSRRTERGPIHVSVVGLVIAIPAMFLSASTGSFPVSIGWLVLFGITRTFCDVNLIPILCLVSDARYRGTAIGVISTCTSFTGGVMIYVVGVLRDLHFSLGHIFACAAASMLICIVLLLAIRVEQGADGTAA